MVKLYCIARYVAPDGEVYERGSVCMVSAKRAALLQRWAEGQFTMLGASEAERAPVANAGAGSELGELSAAVEDGPPVDRAVRRAAKQKGRNTYSHARAGLPPLPAVEKGETS